MWLMKRFLGGALAISLIATTLVACTPEKNSTEEKQKKAVETTDSKSYVKLADANYSYEFAKSLEQFKTNEKLGYRTAGSTAELQTGKKIANEMKKIGLTDVSKDEITVDSWTFKKADLKFTDAKGKTHLAVLGGYQTNFDTKGPKTFDVVYANRGTAADLENLDVKGKLVLIDINQREDWWINYPTYQAHLKGAAAVIAVQSKGYAEVDGNALNAQDICGPDDAPAFSMSQNDAALLKAALKKQHNKLQVDFDAKSTVKKDQKTYNYYGKIEGKDPDSYVILSGHYDSYFDGFQDDNASIGLLMGIAKGLVDSGYKPQKTIIFNALAAEEWGVSNTRYDWSTGAYNQIFRVHPEWVGKAIANLNFELPAYEHTKTNEIRAVYEYKDFLTKFAKTVPTVKGVYKKGISVVAPLRTWSDDFSFSLAGVPALRNDFQDSEFMHTHYHSQFDNEKTNNIKALQFNMNLYGLLAMKYDQTAVSPLNFTTRLEEMKKTLKQDVLKDSNVSSDTLISTIDEAISTAKQANKKVNEINSAYAKALQAGEDKKAAKLYKESRDVNSKLLHTFKLAQDQFVRLTWEDEPIFPHEHAQNNIENLSAAIKAIEKGKAQKALDDYLFAVDNNWYAYDFDKETYQYFTDYVMNQPADRLMWGAGRVMGHEDLYDVISALQEKSKKPKANLDAETKELQKALENEVSLLKKTVKEENHDVQQLKAELEKIK